jgi:FkbM family methyltransferase
MDFLSALRDVETQLAGIRRAIEDGATRKPDETTAAIEALKAQSDFLTKRSDFTTGRDAGIVNVGQFALYFFKGDAAYTAYLANSPDTCDIPLERARSVAAARAESVKTNPLDPSAFISTFAETQSGDHNQIHIGLICALKVAGIDANFIDVGANVGDTAVMVADAMDRIGTSGRVVSFEPGSVFDLARANVDLNKLAHRIEVRNVAASDESGYLPMRVLLGHTESGSIGGIEKHYDIPVAQTTFVKANSLDEELEPVPGDFYVKIDAEGVDFAVLRGAKKLIDAGRIPVVHFEFTPRYQSTSDQRAFKELAAAMTVINLRRTDRSGAFDVFETIAPGDAGAFTERVSKSPHGWVDILLVKPEFAASEAFGALKASFQT